MNNPRQFKSVIDDLPRAIYTFEETAAKENNGGEPVVAYAVLLFNEKGEFLSSNTIGQVMLGYTANEISILKLADILPSVYTGKLPVKSSQLKKINHIHAEKQVLRKDGTFLFAEISAHVLTDGYFEVVMKEINNAAFNGATDK